MTTTAEPDLGQASNGTALPAPATAIVQAGGGNYPSADNVKARLEAAGTSQAHIDNILWLLQRGRMGKLSQQRLGATIGYDGSVVSRLFNGTYPADIQPIIDKIQAHRRLLAQEMMTEDMPICETWVVKEVANLNNMVRKARTIGILTGRSHTGKTTAEQVYTARNNHGQTIYVRMPPGGAARMFLLELARACNISERNAYDQLRDRLIRFFKPGMLLIVDEVHQTIINRRLQTVTLELLRDLHDLTGCGLVLCGTPVFEKSVKDDRVGSYFEQINNRSTFTLRLPDTAPWQDVVMILEAYGLSPVESSKPGEQIVRAMIKSHGLGKLVKFLVVAREVANKRKEVFSWQHVIGTDAKLKSMARGDGPDDQKEGA